MKQSAKLLGIVARTFGIECNHSLYFSDLDMNAGAARRATAIGPAALSRDPSATLRRAPRPPFAT
ncbi:MAG: hypothetical protein AAGK82_03485, partial [Pseudomonadota bacterium]